MIIHLDVGRKKSINALEEAMVHDRLIVLATQKDAQNEAPGAEDIFSVGTIAEVKQLLKLPGGNIRVLVEGLNRASIENLVELDTYYQAEIEEFVIDETNTSEIEALSRTALRQFEQWVKLSKKIPPETVASIIGVDEPGRLADLIASQLTLKIEDKQLLLDAAEVSQRLTRLCEIMAHEMEILEIERRISGRVRKQMERTQKEYYLREQIKAIQKELSEKDEKTAEIDEYRQRLAELDLPTEAAEKAEKEIGRLEKMPPMAAESAVIRTYLDCLLALPWTNETVDRLDIEAAEAVLDEDHYGLLKVKERILEYLSIRKLKNTMKGPILCLVGPPGVGKTSLARSVARAMERKFVRVSLGGVRDEAEIRGHRRTYVGALPGRVIQGMRTAGSRNPVFLLDEIDKMNADFRGDPSSALLEVLDPEQNNSFSDHYVEIAFDLSRVLWILTANAMHNIPRPLLDRMEIINIPGYTEEEKTEIAKRYLVPKQMEEHGLTDKEIVFPDGAIKKIIREYTREAGVRNLERSIATLCRKVAREIVQKKRKMVRLSAQNLHIYLGAPRNRHNYAELEAQVGVSTGLAWTEAGGDVLPTEVSVMKGTGKLTLTGQLGEVMRESAQAGFSYIRAKAATLGIAEEFHEKTDIHIHLPEGAIPKDGPSAGIAMATAVASALLNKPVRPDVAMTGEITLRGRVLPVGGIKEKVLAAHRAGIKTVLLPQENKRELDEIPANVKRALDLVLVSHMDEVLDRALLTKGDDNEGN